jgi:hypothetical protein
MEVKEPVKTETAPEVKVETPAVEVNPEPAPKEPKIAKQMASSGQLNLEEPGIKSIPYRKEMDTKLSFEERIIAYLDSRAAGASVKLNDFLKSLYPAPKGNMPPAWTDQGNMKRLRVLLDAMQSQGKIEIVANAHMQLGKAHYPDTTTMKTEYHNLATVGIECVKK